MTELHFVCWIVQDIFKIRMTLVLLSSWANYIELHYDAALQTIKQKHTAGCSFRNDIALRDQYKQEDFWRDYNMSVKY